MRQWWYGPNGEAEIFDSPDTVPEGWADHPDKAVKPVRKKKRKKK